jgi:hypothetical protein
MRRRIFTLHLTLAALMLTAMVPLAAQAQQPTRDLVPIKLTLTGVGDSFLIPMDPPILSTRVTATGQFEALGQQSPVTWVAHGLVTLGADGTPLSLIDARAVMTTANGDAAFVHGNALIRPSSKAGFIAFEGTWTLIGGRGLFLGGSGGGTWTGEQEIATGKITYSVEGLDWLPNAKKA